MSAGRNDTDIAIIGMACRVPGADDYHQFWRNLCEGVESITRFSDEELLAAGVSAEHLRDPDFVKSGFVIRGIDRFDAEFFEVSPKEACLMDPQHRMLLEVAWHAFEDAGHCPGGVPEKIGVVVGTGGVVTSYLLNELDDHEEARGRTANLVHLGNDKDFSSTRLSYKFDLTGPSINVQTACSTSLVAVHLACRSIRTGECGTALAAISTVRVPEALGYRTQKGSIYSPDGHVRTFDADSRGTVFGSAVAAVLLKDLRQAIADGDPIHAVIKATAVNNDGADKASYSASSVAGQAGAMLEALDAAGVSPDEIGYVECHGTGTVVGDPIEIHALTHAFRTSTERVGFCPVGSVKPNIGHPEQAAGLASLIKTVLAIRHGRIPPTINVRTLNPVIRFDGSPFFVNTELSDWPADGKPRRALVNSLGIGGTNGVVILEEAPKFPTEVPAEPAHPVATDDASGLPAIAERPVHVAVLSAKSETALSQLLEQHRLWLEANPDASLGDVCHTLAVGRGHFTHRYAASAATTAELAGKLALGGPIAGRGGRRRIGFLFSGQGSQIPGMARDLYRTQPVFRAALDRCAEALRPHLETGLLDILFAADATADLIHQTAYTQPALFAVEVALAELLGSWGIRPDAVVGHSVGEFAAAHLAGAYTLEAAAGLIAARGRLMQALPAGGAMAAVFADEETVRKAIADSGVDPDEIGVGAVNGPQSTVLSGSAEAVGRLTAILETQGIAARPLKVSHAFHSPLLAPAMPELRAAAAAAPASAPRLLWISNLTGGPVTEAPSADYWCDHALKAVRFADGVRAMAAEGITDFIEIGPGKSLLALGQTTAQGEGLAWLATIGRDGAAWKELAETAAVLYRRGHRIDWQAFDRPYAVRRIPLPTYPFQRERHWIDRAGDRAGRGAAAGPQRIPGQGWPGRRVRSPLRDIQYESVLDARNPAWMTDHRVHGRMVLPTTAALTALLQAAAPHFGSAPLAIQDFSYHEALILPDDGERAVSLLLSPGEGSTLDARLSSSGGDDAPWIPHITGRLRPGEVLRQPPLDLAAVRGRCGEGLPADRVYGALAAIGLTYGPAFRGVQTLWRGDGEVLAQVRLPDIVAAADGDPPHPALLDACLHIYPAVIEEYGDFVAPPLPTRTLHLPVAIEGFAMAADGRREVWAYARRRSAGEDGTPDGTVVVDIDILDLEGHPVAEIAGLTLKPVPVSAFAEHRTAADWLYRVSWKPSPAMEVAARTATAPSHWLILADDGGVGQALAARLTAQGATCRLLSLDGIAAEDGMAVGAAEFAEPIDSLIRNAGGGPAGVVSLWGLDAHLDPDGDAEIEPARRRAFGNLLLLTQALAEARNRHPAVPRLWVVTRNAVSATGTEPPQAVVQGGLWGFGRSVSLEAPALWGGLADLEAADADGSEVEVAALADHLLRDDGEDQVAFRDRTRYVARFVRQPVPERSAQPVATTLATAGSSVAGCWLITGGLGALGVETARWLIQSRGVRDLVLASRRGADDPAAKPVIEMLEGLGARVTVAKADIGRRKDVQRLLQKLGRGSVPLRGIVHSAGVLDDATIPQMGWEKFRRATIPKLDAAWYLHRYSRDLPLDAFVVYSSILSLFGAGGQVNYTSGNGCLDALVTHRRRLGLPALAINWGPWAAVGLATLSGEQGEAIWRARGLIYIPPEVGAEALDAVVGSEIEQAAVTINDWTAFARQFTRPPRYYEEVLPAAAVAESAEPAALPDGLTSTEPAQRRSALVAVIGQQVMATLGLTKPVDPTRPLRELGLDSLMAVTLINRVEAGLSVRIPAVVLIRGPSIEELVDEVWPDLKGAGGPAVPGPDRTVRAEAVREVVRSAPVNGQGSGQGQAQGAFRPAGRPEGRNGAYSGGDNGSPWLVTIGRRREPRMRLICFPFAGGGSAVFRDWANGIDPTVEVLAVEPPGRLARITEDPVHELGVFVDRVLDALAGRLDRPIALFGHCLGGLTMYEVARKLISERGVTPQHIFVSGARAPDRVQEVGRFEKKLGRAMMGMPGYRPEIPPYRQSEQVFAAMLRHFDMAATEQFLRDPELRRLMLPAVRAEFEMTMNYRFQPTRPWDVPLTCFISYGDPYVSREDVLGWGRFTNSRFQVHIRRGSHYSIVEDALFIQSTINHELASPSAETVGRISTPRTVRTS
ncbi:polyketide synthase (plasmid) [Azospirillum sp. B510]|uniref:type I polyketide synthase n=1 Tax=Azospirillum sp. (strain B510) TaxID=137722 RepID=UPI0001C4C91B|nr:type I polyketide synthase [Azospirillum sp. B510]BAI76223.1 polyketide synthase [Azospirillum sp. B510]